MDKIIEDALNEDIGRGDITSNLLIPTKKVEAMILAKEKGIFCGMDVARQIFSPEKIRYKFLIKDGQKIKKGQTIARLDGDAKRILKVERTVLNFLQHLSGIATLTNKYVILAKPYNVKIYDTRKTTPGLRDLEKYAVRCGGGYNHRMSLHDMVLIKDNHLRLIDKSAPLSEKIRKIKRRIPKKVEIEVEAECLGDIPEALEGGADIIMLDNMAPQKIKEAINLIKASQYKGKPLIEISGGVSLKNIRSIAKLSVDRISIGALTHSAPALDMSLEIVGKK